MDTIIIGAVFVIYLGVMVVIGMKYYNKEDDMSEYILGGRKLPPIAVAMSAQASDMSGWLLTGLPGAGVYTLRRNVRRQYGRQWGWRWEHISTGCSWPEGSGNILRWQAMR